MWIFSGLQKFSLTLALLYSVEREIVRFFKQSSTRALWELVIVKNSRAGHHVVHRVCPWDCSTVGHSWKVSDVKSCWNWSNCTSRTRTYNCLPYRGNTCTIVGINPIFIICTIVVAWSNSMTPNKDTMVQACYWRVFTSKVSRCEYLGVLSSWY